MFNQNKDEEKKLDWMYKGPNSTVNREEYLLGRPVDKTLEQINEEEKQKQQGLIPQPKNRVEHECIPPSIRDFNKLVQAEQVDLSTKLQEDPLVAIKKREEETRRQFLQNPVQLKKLQKALKAQQAKKNKKKKKKSKDSDSDLELKLTEKLFGAKSKKSSKEERNLDIIIMHKFEALKDKLSESDLQDILNGKITDSDDSSDDEKSKKKSRKKHETSDESEDERRQRNYKNVNRRDNFRRRERSRGRDSSDDIRRRRDRNQERSKDKTHKDSHKEYSRDERRYKKRSRSPRRKSSSESESDAKTGHYKKYDSDDSDSSKNKNKNYGLVTSDGKKIPLLKKYDKKDEKPKLTKTSEPSPLIPKHRVKKLTEEEKEKLRQEMMQNALQRDKERAYNLKKHREKEEKERKEQNFDPDFIHKQLLKSADTSSVESRIKSNLNNIQRSSRDMDKHFSRR